MARLYKELLDLKENGPYPFHMPGHKRNRSIDFLKDAYEIDITEIDGYDNLHDAKGIIKEAQDNAARLYHSSESHFLVNGTTGGILSAIFSLTNKGDKIIVARNCHKSVYNAIALNELQPIYIYPEIIEPEKIASSIRPEQVEKIIIDNPDAKALLITSPTYDGVISNVAEIARKAHEFDIPLIVDEAHGALFFMEGRSAVMQGADIVINSVHKTLPALTQTALLHVNGELVNREKLRENLTIFQTSSPSYVLMASIDYAMELIETKGSSLYRDYCIRTVKLKEELSRLTSLRLITKDSLIMKGVNDFDEGKILISTAGSGISGKTLSDILLMKYNIQVEMSAKEYAILMTTLMDTMDGVNLLINALKVIDTEISKYVVEKTENNTELNISLKVGSVSDKTVFIYPPGIPIIVKGEKVTEEVITEIKNAVNAGLDVKGI